MKNHPTMTNTSRTSKIVLMLSIVVSGYWFLSAVINPYRWAFCGAIYEILWLPFLAMLFVLPIVSLVFLLKTGFHFRSLYLYSVIISAGAILFLFLGNKS